jgi:hypothetical protein
MKCPRCSHQHKKKLGPICGRCERSFVFFGDSRMTDGRFANLVKQASGNGTYFFTERQLCSEWFAKMRGTPSSFWKILGVVGTVTGLTSLALPEISWLPWIGFGGLLVLALQMVKVSAPEQRIFDAQFAKWSSAEPMEGLLRGCALDSPPPEWNEPQMLDVGVEALLVVDDPLLVDFFVLNQAHTEHRVLVVSSHGYPDYILPAVKRVMETQPDVPVCYLHGTGVTAEELRQRLNAKVSMAAGVHRDLGWNWEEASNSGRVRKAGHDKAPEIALDWLPPKKLMEGLGRALSTEVRFVEATGLEDGDQDMHFG